MFVYRFTYLCIEYSVYMHIYIYRTSVQPQCEWSRPRSGWSWLDSSVNYQHGAGHLVRWHNCKLTLGLLLKRPHCAAFATWRLEVNTNSSSQSRLSGVCWSLSHIFRSCSTTTANHGGVNHRGPHHVYDSGGFFGDPVGSRSPDSEAPGLRARQAAKRRPRVPKKGCSTNHTIGFRHRYIMVYSHHAPLFQTVFPRFWTSSIREPASVALGAPRETPNPRVSRAVVCQCRGDWSTRATRFCAPCGSWAFLPWDLGFKAFRKKAPKTFQRTVSLTLRAFWTRHRQRFGVLRGTPPHSSPRLG